MKVVSQIFGARVAYKAMLKDYADSEITRPQEYLVTSPDSEMISLNADQLFFMAYGKVFNFGKSDWTFCLFFSINDFYFFQSNCELGQKELRTILMNLDEYYPAFDCNVMYGKVKLQCPLNGFQIQKRNYFVNKPF